MPERKVFSIPCSLLPQTLSPYQRGLKRTTEKTAISILNRHRSGRRRFSFYLGSSVKGGTSRTTFTAINRRLTKRADNIRPYGWNVGFYRNAVGAHLCVRSMERNPSVFLFAKQTKIHLLLGKGGLPFGKAFSSPNHQKGFSFY
ncbi:MAG: hypothetical protein IKL18_02415 [Oscillospiraceae bacterium]|nr:hypothetical protein [Oscillospiraceae bacterium]